MFILLLNTSQAQQPQVYNQFFMNPYMYNPAYAGVEGHAAVFVMYRNQWTNIDGSPQISHASFHVPLKGGIALGGAAFNITQGLLTTSAAKISSSYLINIDRTHYLRFGMSLGGGVNGINISEFDSPGDDAFENFLDQSAFFIGDFGVAYHFGHFNAGIALPNLFSYNPVTQKEVADIEFSATDNILFKMNYRGHISDDFAFEPHFIYRYSSVVPHQYEAVLIAHLYHIVWVGASYREDEGPIALGGAKIAEKFAIGLSYELGNPNISSLLGPTFEINLGMHLGTKKEHAEHVSSFIKSHRLSAEERARKAELERQQRLAALRQNRQTEEPSDEDELEIAKPTILDDTDPEAEIPTEKADEWDHQEEHEPLTRVNQFGEEEVGIRLEKPTAEDGKNVVISWVPATEAPNLKVAEDGHLERTLPDGTQEVGIKYEKINPDGSVEHIIKWDRAINDTQAAAISGNPELTEEHHDEIAKGDPELTQDFRTHEELANSDQPVVTRRGNHLLELPPGNYVISGAFSVFENAEAYSDKLFQMGFHDTKVGYNSGRGYYYVVVFESSSLSQIRKKRDEFRKIPELSKAWVLQVTE